MRAHRTSIKQNPSENDTPNQERSMCNLLRYTDKALLLKLAASKLKGNKYKQSMTFISDVVSKTLRDERSKLRKYYLQEIKAKPGVVFCIYTVECSGKNPVQGRWNRKPEVFLFTKSVKDIVQTLLYLKNVMTIIYSMFINFS